MPSNVLCNYLKNYYAKRGDMVGNYVHLINKVGLGNSFY
jgi:hypothetical protein